MSEMCPEEKRSRIRAYLMKKTSEDKNFFKAKYIAEKIGLSSREVGSNLKKLKDDDSDEFRIKKHSRSKSTTWKITRKSPGATPRSVASAD